MTRGKSRTYNRVDELFLSTRGCFSSHARCGNAMYVLIRQAGKQASRAPLAPYSFFFVFSLFLYMLVHTYVCVMYVRTAITFPARWNRLAVSSAPRHMRRAPAAKGALLPVEPCPAPIPCKRVYIPPNASCPPAPLTPPLFRYLKYPIPPFIWGRGRVGVQDHDEHVPSPSIAYVVLPSELDQGSLHAQRWMVVM